MLSDEEQTMCRDIQAHLYLNSLGRMSYIFDSIPDQHNITFVMMQYPRASIDQKQIKPRRLLAGGGVQQGHRLPPPPLRDAALAKFHTQRCVYVEINGQSRNIVALC